MAIRFSLRKLMRNAVKSFAQSKRIIILLMCVSVISKSSLEIWMTFDLVADCIMVMVNFLNNEPLNSYLPSLSLPTYLFFLFLNCLHKSSKNSKIHCFVMVLLSVKWVKKTSISTLFERTCKWNSETINLFNNFAKVKQTIL